MNYYTSTIPLPLAEKLKEKGMPMTPWIGQCQILPYISVKEGSNVENRYVVPVYAEVFDWLMERGWLVDIGREYDFAAEQVTERFEWAIEKVGCFSSQPDNGGGWCDTWHEAAEKAIEKALTLIKD